MNQNKIQNSSILGVIPARYKSTRFPGKPLHPINGIPMVVRVYNQVVKSRLITKAVVATDDERIQKVCLENNITAVMTSDECKSGSDRVYQVMQQIDADIYVNIQGDEPVIDPGSIDLAIKGLTENPDFKVSTLAFEIADKTEISNPNVVKVVFAGNGSALYFSRSPIPFNRDNSPYIKYYKHLGLYAYTRKALQDFFDLPVSSLESAENLEQLRLLENGYSIYVAITKTDSIGVDVPEDVLKVEKMLGK